MLSSSIRDGQTVEKSNFSLNINRKSALNLIENFLIKMSASMLKINLLKTVLLKIKKLLKIKFKFNR